MQVIIPIPKHDVVVRLATMGDLPFVDALQKQHGNELGFQAMSWMTTRVAKGEMLVAEEPPPQPSPGCAGGGSVVGYIIFQDKYLRREELGLIVHLCVDPSKQRGLVGAMLVRAAFERAAYGCKLFCLWCAQDLVANKFWEAIGFVPLAYRAGSERKSPSRGLRAGRTHIFWQKRIRAGDDATPYWYPTETTGGAMGAGRIVLPIPLDRHWSEEFPRVLPALPALSGVEGSDVEGPVEVARESCPRLEGKVAGGTPAVRGGKVPTGRQPVNLRGGLFFAPVAAPEPARVAKAKKPKRTKNDPKLVAAARELRDRWLEHLNANATPLLAAKYEITRALPRTSAAPALLLPAA